MLTSQSLRGNFIHHFSGENFKYISLKITDYKMRS